MMPKAVPLAGGGAAALRICICMFDACRAHAVGWCACSSGYKYQQWQEPTITFLGPFWKMTVAGYNVDNFRAESNKL